ncbi:MAG: DUF1559 domain-containing protein [Planctomycetaceae bacterium]|nr:DUF1559 domain-containing protein [Planctomycetaceae bacterium]
MALPRSGHTVFEGKRSTESSGRRGFTLVELLVVIAIISVLAGMLFPAIQATRRHARLAQCVNNQKNIGLAIQHYESAKQHLPGYVNRIPATPAPITCSWAVVLLPYMGRMDLWEGAAGWRTGNGQQVVVKELVCPDDAAAADRTCPLTYVVNIGAYGGDNVTTVGSVPPSTDPQQDTVAVPLQPVAGGSPGALGVFRDYSIGATNALTLSDVKSQSQTVMLSERVFALSATTPRRWDERPPAVPAATLYSRFGFSWPNYQPLPPPVEQPRPADLPVLQNTFVGIPYVLGSVTYWPPLPTIHAGVVVVTFCDGHVDRVNEDAACSAYQALP